MLHDMRLSQEWKETAILKYLAFGNPTETYGHVNIFFSKSWKKTVQVRDPEA